MINRITPNILESVDGNQIFVFDTDEYGYNGSYYAMKAGKFGAKIGTGFGLQGNSFGIPFRDSNLQILSKELLQIWIWVFITFAKEHPELIFKVPTLGLEYYKIEEIAPLFKDAISVKNIHLPVEFWDILNKD